MFKHLIESGSHTQDHTRRGFFFLGTLGFYAVLITIAGVASVYAYDAHVSNQDLELITLLPLPPLVNNHADEPPVKRTQTPRAATSSTSDQASIRTTLLASTRAPLIPDKVSVNFESVPPIPDYGLVKLGNHNSDPANPLLNGARSGGLPTGGVRVATEGTDDPTPPVARATPTPVKLIKVSTLLNSQAISKPVPAYPVIAKQVHAMGIVMVQIVIDEQGRVVSAQATSGHPLLREAAKNAALQARFSPTILGGQPVKVSGVITYNFVLQ